jgi:hypothetical protein
MWQILSTGSYVLIVVTVVARVVFRKPLAYLAGSTRRLARCDPKKRFKANIETESEARWREIPRVIKAASGTRHQIERKNRRSRQKAILR